VILRICAVFMVERLDTFFINVNSFYNISRLYSGTRMYPFQKYIVIP
jgi:hypothetical protein